jgi:hypothetical protein
MPISRLAAVLGRRLKRALIPAALVSALGLVVAQASGSPAGARQGCRAYSSPSLHWDAVFKHVTSRSQALRVVPDLRRNGFRDLRLERDYCDDIEIAVNGLDTPAQRADFAAEASRVDIGVSFEPPDIQKGSHPGYVKAVFGTLPTLARANALQLRAAVNGFREGSDIERLGLHAWRVVLYNIPASSEGDFAAEAASVGFHVTFVSQ